MLEPADCLAKERVNDGSILLCSAVLSCAGAGGLSLHLQCGRCLQPLLPLPHQQSTLGTPSCTCAWDWVLPACEHKLPKSAEAKRPL